MTNYTATANYSKRTFTIRKYDKNKCDAKYRTGQLTPREFHDLLYNTSEDWRNYLKTEQVNLIK
jgi:hypothetical protein